MILLIDREHHKIRGIFQFNELPVEGVGIELRFNDEYLESILRAEKARMYNNMLYIRVDPLRYANKYLKIGTKIDITYNSKMGIKGEVKHGIR